jgi:hypothetical protein
MPSLAEIQMRLRGAVVDGEAAAILPFLIGGANPARRLSIYRRHYDASLVGQILGRYPTVVWLVGRGFATAAAKNFVRRHPPAAPCLAEYGEDFPAFIAGLRGAEDVPYLRSVADIDWCLGEAAAAIEYPAIVITRLADTDSEALLDLRLGLQPGLRYLEAPWPADDLISLHLSEQAPDHYALDRQEVRLEIHGARGAFRITRLGRGVFAFRRAIGEGVTIGTAIERAQQTDPAFDAGSAFISIFADGLVASVTARD